MIEAIRIQTPLRAGAAEALKAGQAVSISGILYTARDAAHKRLAQLIEAGRELPIDLRDQVLYYVGPAPARPGQVIGPAGPTTSTRLDPYTPALLERGLRGMIGKGQRSREVIDSMIRHRAVYFAAVGGAAVLIAKRIKRVEVICYPDLGTEAIHRFTVEEFPAIVVIDAWGNNLYESEPPKYAGL